MKEGTYISAVVYVHNAENEIIDFLLKMESFLNEKFQSYEIILVNDNSTDNTVKRIFGIKDELKDNVTVINLTETHGIERAFLAGTDISIGDYVYEIESVTIDYPIEIIYDMFKKSSEREYDIVFARPSNSVNFKHKILNGVLKSLSDEKIVFNSNHLRLASRRALYAVNDCYNGILNRSVLYKLTGFSYSSITYDSDNNKGNNRKKSNFIQILMIYTKFFDRLPFVLSFLFLSAGLLEILSDSKNIVLISTLLGCSSILFILGLIYKALMTIVRRKVDIRLYKVGDIKRLNRY